jgi:hypothetical protein
VCPKLPKVNGFTDLLTDALSDAPGIPAEFVDGLDFFFGAAGPGDAGNYMRFINGPARMTTESERLVPVSLALYVNAFDLNDVP